MRIGWRLSTSILALALTGWSGGWAPDKPGQSFAVSAARLPSPSPATIPTSLRPRT